MGSPAHIVKCLALVGALAAASACGGSKPKSSGGGSALKLEQSDDFSKSLELAGGDEILTLGRLDLHVVSAASKSGIAYVINLEDDSVETVKPFFKFDGDNASVYTVSKDYTWELLHNEAMVGRNKNPPVAGKFEISKVPIDDLVKDTTKLTPVAATTDQLFLLSKDSLVVFTFESEAINRKKIPLQGGKLRDKEYVLGAGPIDEPGKNYGLWMATNQRLLVFKGTAWSEEALQVKSEEEAPSLISMMLTGKNGERKGETVGLFGSNVLSTLGKPKAKSSKN